MHFLRSAETERPRQLHQPHAAVTVVLVGKDTLRLAEGGISVAKADVYWVELPERMQVVDPDGNTIPRDKRLRRLVSTETFDPYHLLADVREELW